MNKLLTRVITLAILLGVLGIGVRSDGASISATLGMSGECDTTLDGCLPFPSSASLLCDGGGAILDCPQYFAPDWTDATGLIFYGITNRANPPRCVKSTNGGSIWGLCNATTVSPFVGSINNANSGFSVASVGSLISAAILLPNTCIIRRSTDGGANWSTVFTDTTALEVCVFGLGSPTPNGVHCAKSAGRCYISGLIQGGFQSRMYYSGDNGLNWTKGVGFQLVTGDQNNGFAVSDDGEQGSWSMFGQTYNTANWRFAYTVGGDWTFTDPIPLPAGAGSSTRCSGTMIYNGAQAVVCGPDPTMTTTYRLFTHAAGSVNLSQSFIPQGGLTNGQSPDYSVVGFSSSTAYMVGRNAANSQIVIGITRDNFGTMQTLATLTPTTALISGCCRGDMYSHNGKIYFSIAGIASNAVFGIIQ